MMVLRDTFSLSFQSGFRLSSSEDWIIGFLTRGVFQESAKFRAVLFEKGWRAVEDHRGLDISNRQLSTIL